MLETAISQILIVSDVTRLRGSLRVMLKSYFPQSAIDEVERRDVIAQRLTAISKTLVLIDSSLSNGDAWKLFEELGEEFPQHDYVILAHSLEHQKQAIEIGAKVILLDSFTVEDLYNAMRLEMKD